MGRFSVINRLRSVEYITKCLSSFNAIDAVGELTKEEINDLVNNMNLFF